MRILISITLILCLLAACNEQPKKEVIVDVERVRLPEAISLFGDSLYSPEPSEKLVERYNEHKAKFIKDSTDVDNIIWFGRFTAYLGDYNKAFRIYRRGIELFPNDPRLYRHRGHRYISVRKFDAAIGDYEKAVELIAGKTNEIEPDGMPNARNIPVSTLHGNIWYHLGLAHYLNGILEKALDAYKNCLNTGDKPDNIVSATHWIYMILRMLDREKEAKDYLEPINAEMDIIENTAYHQLCLFYKGDLSLEDLQKELTDTPGSDGIKYGIANWYFYSGKKEITKKKLEQLIAQKSWNSFGYIAAESHLKNHF